MSDEIIKILNALAEKFGIMVDWSQQNIQPYLQDLMYRVIQYNLATSVIGVIFCISIIAICLFIIKKNNKKFRLDEYDCIEGSFLSLIYVIVSYILLIIFVILLLFEIENICQCVFLPEKIIINEIQSTMQ